MVDNESSSYFTWDLSANVINLEKVEVSGKIKAWESVLILFKKCMKPFDNSSLFGGMPGSAI